MQKELTYGQMYRFGNWFPAKRAIYFGRAIEQGEIMHTVILRDEYDKGTVAKFGGYDFEIKDGTKIEFIVPIIRPRFIKLNNAEREFVESKLAKAGVWNESE